MSKYEDFVNISPTPLQYDNLSGMMPDRLSYYFRGERKKFLTFHLMEAVSFEKIFRQVKKTAALSRVMLFRRHRIDRRAQTDPAVPAERERGYAQQYVFEPAGG